MKLKTLFILAIAILSLGASSCSSDEEIIYFKDEILIQNNITDVLFCYEKLDISNDSSVLFYCANRNNKLWCALFDKTSGTLKQEWYGETIQYVPGAPQDFISGERFTRFFENGTYIIECKNVGKYFKFKNDGTIQVSNLNVHVEDALNDNCFLIREDQGGYLTTIDFEGSSLGINTIRKFGIDKEIEQIGYIGYKKDKLWAVLQEQNYEPILGLQPHQMTKKIHIGYGEYKDLNTKVFNLSGLRTEWGVALTNVIDYLYYEIICINGNQIKYIGIENPEGNSPLNWYNNSILAYNHVISKEADIIKKVERDDLSSYSNVYPLNYEECICTTNNQITRFSLNPSKESISWTSSIPGIKSDARVTFEEPNKNKNLWDIKCHVVNKDGSKKSITIRVNIENGNLEIL